MRASPEIPNHITSPVTVDLRAATNALVHGNGWVIFYGVYRSLGSML